MAHIHDQPGQHDATVSACIVRTDGPEPAIIMHRHRKLNVWLQFGGHIELNETPWGAVTHEIAEESGYTIDQLKILQPPQRLKSLTGATLHPQPAVINTHQFSDQEHYHTDTTFVFVTDQEPANKLDEGESADIKALNADELKAIPKGEIPENGREICLYVLEEIVGNWEAVDTSNFSTQ